MAVKILADSGSDLPLSFFKENDATLFPLKVLLDGKEYDDLVEIEPITIYQAIRDGKMPKTSQVSPQKFKEVFTEMALNKEEGIYIAFSSELSGTCQTAIMIRDEVKEEYPDLRLEIVDSKCASLGLGLVVMDAVKKAKGGASMEELLERIRFMANHMEHLFTVDDLDHLARGGRVSKASAFLGGLLNIKPLLNVEEGKLVPLEKLRGKKKVLRRMLELMEERGDALHEQTIGISHADSLDMAEEMKKMIMDKFNPREVFITSIGAVIGSHTGPGTISIFFLNKKAE